MRASASRTIPADIVASARRVDKRGALRLAASVHGEGEAHLTAIVTDVTTRGCRMEIDRALTVGSSVTILVRATLVGGRVTWSEAGVIGVEFRARLLPKTLRGMLTANDQA